MKTVHTVPDLHAALQPFRTAREAVALVPTMGNLHRGHASLVARARELAECTVASIFVNPLQFGAGEDFERYPRTLEADCALLEKEGCDIVFAPSVRDMYPGGYPPATTVQLTGPLEQVLEGQWRPGHFTGVATVVTMLLNLVQPDIGVFGEKDYQQLAVIRRVAADLRLPVRIVGAPTVREANGLAMSSRNQYLSESERATAGEIHAGLGAVAAQLQAGRRDFDALGEAAAARLREAGFEPQYVAVRAPDLSAPRADGREFVVLVAALLGRTRLIDNLTVRL